VSQQAVRCLVCGSTLSRAERLLDAEPRTRPTPFFIALTLVLLALGGYLVLIASGVAPMPDVLKLPTPTITPTDTPRPTATATGTPTPTPVPTPTPLPPIEYQVGEGDSCLAIAWMYDVTVESIIMANGLDPNCTIAVGTTIRVPQPTPTITPRPSATLEAGLPTYTPGPQPQAMATHVVQLNETCLEIAFMYGLTAEELTLANGLENCQYLREGQVLLIPIK
jgi:LysM repeat protein